MKKILLTGSTGFIGSNILLTLNKNNKYKIYVTIHKTKPKIKYRNVSYINCNLLKYKDCYIKIQTDRKIKRQIERQRQRVIETQRDRELF